MSRKHEVSDVVTQRGKLDTRSHYQPAHSETLSMTTRGVRIGNFGNRSGKEREEKYWTNTSSKCGPWAGHAKTQELPIG